jgi:hypothetical protein
VSLLSWWNLQWYIGGDFNVTQFPSERLGKGHFTPAIAKFSYFIFYQGLMDLLLVGGTFIWLNYLDLPS